MGMDYSFWKYKSGADPEDQKVYELLSEGIHVDDVEELPIAEIVEKIELSFQDSISKESFQIFTTPQFVRVDVYGAMPNDEVNKLIDIMLEYDCPLFDAQIGVRFG